MNKISFWASLFLLTCFFLHDCTQVPKKPDLSLSTPSWVFNIPFEDGKIFAVGSCGRTYWQIDAWKLASDDARSELAKNLQAKIRNAFLLVQSSDGTNWADKAFVVEATSSATDIVMKNSQIVAL